MKKNLFALGVMLAATFTLTNCTKEIQNPDEVVGNPYTIYAETADTKTANNGLSTVWAEGDALNVFHAAAGSTEYSANTQFTLTDAATGQFDTEALAGELSATNDWYVLYPYSKHVATPASTNSGYINVGALTIKQNGYDNMEHLSGTNCPLYGVAKGVSAQTLPALTMHQLTSVVKVEVTNNAGKAVTISNVALTAEEDIVGTYYVNFAGDEVVYTGSGENYVSTTATLTVTDAPELPAGKTAAFYIPVKPFVAAVGTELELAVNGEGKSLEMSKNVSFEAGSIKTLKYSMDEVVEQEVLTISEVIASENGAQVLTAGLVVGTYARGVLIQDETGYLLVYDGSSAPAKVGDMIEVSGAKATYGGLAQIGTPVVTVKSSGNKVTRPVATVLDGAAMDEQLSATAVSYIEYTGTLAVSGNYYNVTVDGATTAVGSLSYPDASLGLSDLNGKTIKVTGYFIGVSGNNSQYLNTMVVAVEEVSTGEEPEPEPGNGELTHPLTSNLVWTLGEKAYSDKVIINETEYDALKLGTSSVIGTATITIPAGTTKVGFYGVAWNGKAGKVTASADLAGGEFFSQELVSNTGANNQSPYTIATPSDADYYEIDVVTLLGSAAPLDITVTISTVGNAFRAVIWGLNYYTASGIGENQSGTTEPEPEVPATPPTSSGTKTVAEFINSADTQNYYELTGTVSNFNANYCSFDLTDESGTIYVYSVLDASKSEWSSQISNGGTITIYGKYLYYVAKSQHEVVDAHIVSFTAGATEPDPGTTADVTIDLTAQGYTNQQDVTSLTVDGVTVAFDKGTNSNAPKWYDSGAAVRVYGGGTFAVSASKEIASIKLTYGTGDGTNEITVNNGSFDTDTWTGSANEVTFTVGGTKGNRRIAKIEVTYN